MTDRDNRSIVASVPGSFSKRIPQIILIATFIPFCWLAMQVVHETGHMLLARITKGEVTKVALHPLIMSRTDLAESPHPLAVVWGGPLLGSILPLLAYFVAFLIRIPCVYLFRFSAGFCLVANGVYIGTGWLIANGADPGVLLENGSPKWLLVVFGLLTFPSGLYLWHRQGHHFGLAEANGKISDIAAGASAALLAGLVAFELIWNQHNLML